MQQFITIRHTSREWEIINGYLTLNKLGNIHSFINNRLYSALRSCQDIENCECDKSIKKYIIPADICMELETISRMRCIPLSAIVQRNFIDPILLDHSRKSGFLL